MKTFLAFVFFLPACYSTKNSTTRDFEKFAEPTNSTEAPEVVSLSFQKFHAVIMASCVSCHATWAKMSQRDWENKPGLILPRNPPGSGIVKNLKQMGGEMPDNGTVLSEDGVAAIKDFIMSLNPSTN